MQEVSYPCVWHYRIIGESEKELEMVAFEKINKPFIKTQGKQSSSGKYCSINIELQVESKSERDLIFSSLQSDSRVKFVI